MTGVLVQRIVLPAAPGKAALYWRVEPSDGVIELDTYFNSFDEAAWLRNTRLAGLRVSLTVSGPVMVQLWRHTRDAPPLLLAEVPSTRDMPDGCGTVSIDVPAPPHPRAAGRLALRLVPGRGMAGRRNGGDVANTADVTLHGGEWRCAAEASAVRLMPVICTFDRDTPLFALLHRIAADEVVCDALAGLVVVNNGTPGLRDRVGASGLDDRLGGKLHIVEQLNLGGAGGFTRGLITARDLGATHAILMDDDVEIEPEAILRTQRLFALATREFNIAGHMLDLFRPTHLYEAGARLIDAKLALQPLHADVDLALPKALDRFLEPTAMHYNGWWFLGLPLTVPAAHGWPMPCFIRGDDVEYGRRLHDAGVAQIAMPGIGIWHEPFYAKLGSWHLYYEFRNMLVLASTHFGGTKNQLARRLGVTAVKWIVADLLTFRYQRVALLMRAIGDFLDGPVVFARDPRVVHASLGEIRRRYPTGTMARDRVVAEPQPPVGPRSRPAFVAGVLGALIGEWVRGGPGRGTIRVEARDHVWFRVRRADAVVVNEGWEVEQPVYQRSRPEFRALALASIRLVLRMLREMGDAVAAWRGAHGTFTSEAEWMAYFDRHGRDAELPAAIEAVDTARHEARVDAARQLDVREYVEAAR